MDRPTCRCLPKRGRRPPATENPDGFVEYARKSFEIVTEPTRSASRLRLGPSGGTKAGCGGANPALVPDAAILLVGRAHQKSLASVTKRVRV